MHPYIKDGSQLIYVIKFSLENKITTVASDMKTNRNLHLLETVSATDNNILAQTLPANFLFWSDSFVCFHITCHWIFISGSSKVPREKCQE